MAVEHAAEHGGIPELPNIITLLSSRWHDSPLVSWLHHWENLVFALLIGAVLSLIAWRYARKPAMLPGGWQNVLELLVESIDQFVQRIIGPAGRRHTPFIGTLFLYIWVRWTVPRYRYDQLMQFGWKWLFPASVINLIVTAAGVLYFNA